MRMLFLFGLIGLLAACSTPSNELKRTYLNPVNGYAQVVVVEQFGIKTLYVSGQIGEGEDFESQLRDTWKKVEAELKNAGATLEDLVKINTYIADYQTEHIQIFRKVREDIMEGMNNRPASTLVGVTALAVPGRMVEIEAVAVVK